MTASEQAKIDKFLRKKKEEVTLEEYTTYCREKTTEQILVDIEFDALGNLPNPELHQQISFIKSAIRIAACSLGAFGFIVTAFVGLVLAELVGVLEELV